MFTEFGDELVDAMCACACDVCVCVCVCVLTEFGDELE